MSGEDQEPLKTVPYQPTVYEAWSAVMEEVQTIGKNSRNNDQNFNFRGIDAVMDAVGPVLRKHSVIVIPSVGTVDSERYETKRGANMVNRVIEVMFTVHGPRGDSFSGSVYGEAADSGDKSVSKAHSVAYRTFLLQALTIPTGEADPDANSHERTGAASIVTLDELKEAADRAGASREDVLAYAGTDDPRRLSQAKLKDAVAHFTELAVQKELAK